MTTVRPFGEEDRPHAALAEDAQQPEGSKPAAHSGQGRRVEGRGFDDPFEVGAAGFFEKPIGGLALDQPLLCEPA